MRPRGYSHREIVKIRAAFIQQRIRHIHRRQQPTPLPSRTAKSRAVGAADGAIARSEPTTMTSVAPRAGKTVPTVLAHVGVSEHGLRTLGALLRFRLATSKKHCRANESCGDARPRNVDGDARVRDNAWLGGDGIPVGAHWIKSAQVLVIEDD